MHPLGVHSEVGKLRVVPTGGDSFGAAREQWDDANNVVALEPGGVVAYSKNVAGRGGCHCMTCPIARNGLT